MAMTPVTTDSPQDPRQLRALFDRASLLACQHAVGSVFVGIAGREGDTPVRDFLDFVESELRVEDSIFRLLRERAVLLLTDVDADQAIGIVERLESDFSARFPITRELRIAVGYHPVRSGHAATAKEVLPGIFSERPPR